ncbi:vWA domain-containing protein [Arthrobacter sp.]|uniref:vWA domain-containing protein n=1 Tax=Arthrobacter sp. TaxID=1667 RepID=UPI002810CE95|nr:vWA domain-containing protein [Arthrobacter sp.]
MTFSPIFPWWMLGLVSLASMVLVFRMLSRGSVGSGTPGRAATRRADVRDWLFRGGLVILLVLAALRPGLPGGHLTAAASNLNVFFVVDTTSSMVAEDFGNSEPRMQGVKADILSVARELSGARYSVITFDSSATVRMPLTVDSSALATVTSLLGPQVTNYSTGSSVTMAGKVLQARLQAAGESHPERPRIVYYLGDGEQTSAERPAPLGVETGLVDGGAVLGYGTPEGGKMRENTGAADDSEAGYIKDRSGGESRDAISRIDEDQLRKIADQLGVPYVHRTAGASAAPMLQDARPGNLDRSAQVLDGRTELYWIPALAALLLALREGILVVGQLRMLRPLREG